MSFFRSKVNLILTVIAIGFSFNIQAQDGHICGTDIYWGQMVKDNPAILTEKLQAEQALLNYAPPRHKNGSKVIIPVVFHVIHTYGPENVSKANIEAQLETLNKSFNQGNADELALVNPAFKNSIGNIGIEFRLAKKDPNGKCTEGINRIYSTQTEDAHDNVKPLSRWDPSKYLNIWVVKSINSPPGSTILGYAYYPFAGNANVDGIVIKADQIVSGNKTLTHETGHYFGLHHTFEGEGEECGDDCQSTGDRVCDTPPTDKANYGCPIDLNSCQSDNPDLPDMVENFMDYGNCTYMFTNGQDARVQYWLTYPNRASLHTLANLTATGVADGSAPTTCAPVADFHVEKFTVCAGTPVKFYDQSFNGSVTSYEWNFGGGTPSVSADKNPSVTYSAPGTYNVTLQVYNSSGSSTKTKNAVIKVLSSESIAELPFAEDFESYDPAEWSMPSNDVDGMKWEFSNVSSSGNTGSLFFNNSEAMDQTEYGVVLPSIDMTTLTSDYKLKFDVAYAMKSTTLSKDVLQVGYSTDCGLTFHQGLYYNTGVKLNTAGSPVTGAFIPSESQWREETVDLSSFKNEKTLHIRFSIFNRGGNDIYIDNIRIGSEKDSGTAVVEATVQGGIEIYPNPVAGKFFIKNTSNEKIEGVEIYDISGKTLYKNAIFNNNNLIGLDLHTLNISSAGMYYVKLSTQDRSFVQKFVVSHP